MYSGVSLKCRPQHGCRRWQPLIAQVPAGKSEEIPQLHGGVQLSKIADKNNHTWDVNLLKSHSSGIFLGNMHLHGLIQFPKYNEFHAWHLLSIRVGVRWINFIFEVPQ